MHRNWGALGAVGLLAIGAGVVLLPRAEERAAMSVRDGDPAAALALLERLRSPARPEIAMQIHILQAEAGNAAEAIQALEEYLVQRPRDVAALKRLERFFHATMQPERRRKVLERLAGLDASEAAVQDLAATYRQSGDNEREVEFLIRLQEKGRLGYEDLERLGAMLVKEGDTRRALDAYREADTRAPMAHHAGRLKLFELLLLAKEQDEAVSRALRWVAEWKKPYLPTLLVHRLADAGHASAILNFITRVRAIRPELEAGLIEAAAAAGARRPARAALHAWATDVRARSTAELTAFVDAAQEARDPTAPLSLLTRYSSMPDRRGEAVTLAERIAREFGIELLSSHPIARDASALSEQPLFGAELALLAGNPELARHVLVRGRPERIAERDVGRWAKLLFEVLGTRGALEQIALMDSRQVLTVPARRALDAESVQRGVPARFAVLQPQDIGLLNQRK